MPDSDEQRELLRAIREVARSAGQGHIERDAGGEFDTEGWKRLCNVGLARIVPPMYGRAGGFDMAVRYHSRLPVAGDPWPHEPALRELARWADRIVIAPATADLLARLAHGQADDVVTTFLFYTSDAADELA